MKSPKIALPAITLVMTLPLLAYSVLTQAAEDAVPVKSALATPSPQDQAARQFSEAGHSAMLSIRNARIAIFNGDPKHATQMIESAKTFVEQAQKEAPTFELSSKETVSGRVVDTASESRKVQRVPVDGRITLADDFVMTPEKQVHAEKANEQLKKGDQAKALEELRLSAINVNYTRAWMPIESAEKHLDQAIKLANGGKYYQTNLELKAIEDSVTVDSIALSELPKSAA